MEIPKLDLFSQQSRDPYINYVYFKSEIMGMRSRCVQYQSDWPKWLSNIKVLLFTHFVHTKGTITTLLQINIPKASLNFSINLSLLCYKYLITVKEMLFYFDEWYS